MFLNLLSFVMLSFGLASTTADHNKSKCYKEFCYLLLEENKMYSERSICPSPYQYLEIYNQEMMDDVERFAVDVDAKMNFVELKLDCFDERTCVWRDSGIAAQYLNWKSIDFTKDEMVVFVILLKLRYDWQLYSKDVFFSTICMRKQFAATTDHEVFKKLEEGSRQTKNDCKMEILIFSVASGAVHVISFITIVVLIAALLKNKRRTYSLRSSLKNNKKQETTNNYTNSLSHDHHQHQPPIDQSKYETQRSKNSYRSLSFKRDYNNSNNFNDDASNNFNDDASCNSNNDKSDYANLGEVKKN